MQVLQRSFDFNRPSRQSVHGTKRQDSDELHRLLIGDRSQENEYIPSSCYSID